jgi:hypothetical protein
MKIYRQSIKIIHVYLKFLEKDGNKMSLDKPVPGLMRVCFKCPFNAATLGRSSNSI